MGGKEAMRRHVIVSLFALAGTLPSQDTRSVEMKLGQGSRGLRSGTILSEQTEPGGLLLPEMAGPVAGGTASAQIQLRGGNTQVNDPQGDIVQIFSGFRPFVRATQSEVALAASGNNIVVTYNNSAGIRVAPSGTGLVTTQVLISGYSTSNDGGRSWTSGFMPPPVTGGASTSGDPSIAVDRHGNFHFAQMAGSGAGFGIYANKSTDGGRTWSAAVPVQVDTAADKEWIAVGPDPAVKSRDNVYVTWTSFRNACELRFGRSTDGGATFTAKTIFVPTANANPTFPQDCLQFSNVVVDSIRGTIYIPFLRFSNADQDFIQMMISDDAGETFRFATFNVPGAPGPTLYPVTQPGHLTSCSTNNVRLTIHTAASSGTGQFGLPRFIEASRLVLQPSTAARNGVVYIAWNNSTSNVYGDPNSGSNILFIRSDDGGSTWSGPVIANPIMTNDTQHVLPALALDHDPQDVHISYYTQHANGSVDLDMANSHDRGATFPINRVVRVSSQSFNLPPTNNRLTGSPTFSATNYDRQIAVCYGLGEYNGLTTANGTVYAAWGDARNLITQPLNSLDPISGQVHPQQDVFFQIVKAQ
jgi:hypothetical protein